MSRVLKSAIAPTEFGTPPDQFGAFVQKPPLAWSVQVLAAEDRAAPKIAVAAIKKLAHLPQIGRSLPEKRSTNAPSASKRIVAGSGTAALAPEPVQSAGPAAFQTTSTAAAVLRKASERTAGTARRFGQETARAWRSPCVRPHLPHLPPDRPPVESRLPSVGEDHPAERVSF